MLCGHTNLSIIDSPVGIWIVAKLRLDQLLWSNILKRKSGLKSELEYFFFVLASDDNFAKEIYSQRFARNSPYWL